MKRRIIPIVLVVLVLLSSYSIASTKSAFDFSSFSDDQLVTLYQAVVAEASDRGLTLSDQVRTAPKEADDPMVWVPKSGSKYHSKSSCSGMKNPSQVTLSMAKELGYTPCKKCNPPK